MGDRGIEMGHGRRRKENGVPLHEIDEMRIVREQEEPLPQPAPANGPFAPEQVEAFNRDFKMPKETPLHVQVNLFPVVLLLAYIVASAFYFYIRITKTLVTGPVFVYGIIVLVIEFMGLSASLPYVVLLTISLLPKKGTKGLPTRKEAERTDNPKRYNFQVRCLIPCYKEPLETIRATVTAALMADLPVGTERVVYLCDDGNSPDKRAMIEELIEKGHTCQYVTGREKALKEINGKSSNLNNCLQNVIYDRLKSKTTFGEVDYRLIPETEILVVFDADMVAKKHFFTHILEPLTNDQYALCLSPQSFHNINPSGDLFNNLNLQFWEYWLPGAVAWGYIACTGTNFAIRVKPLAHCGWFPTYTITEDYALGMELKMHGYQGSYLLNYLAPGEAPDEVRNVMRQRSRWCKGHMQVFFSWAMCPLLQWRLSLPMKLWYSYGTWTYIVNIFSVPMALLIPFLSLAFGLNPVVVNRWFAIAATPYYACIFLTQTYFHKVDHIKSLFFAGVSNVVLSFTYTKAVVNVLLSKAGLKDKGGFKATVKKDSAPAPNPVVQMARSLTRIFSRGRAPAPVVSYNSLASQSSAGSDSPTGVGDFPATPGVTVHGDRPSTPVNVTVVVNANNGHEAEPLLPAPLPPPKKRKPWPSRLASVFSPKNLVDMGGVLDPAALCIMLAFCLALIGMGLWRIITIPAGGRGARYVGVSPYIALPMMWSIYNAIPPFLFVFYCFTSGKPFVRAAGWLRLIGSLTVIGAVFVLWLTVPVEFNMTKAASTANEFITRQSAVAAKLGDMADLGGGQTQALTGGWLIGGDPVRYGMPLATGASLLAWSLIEFPTGFKAAGSYDAAVKNVVAVASYINANWNPTDKVFIAQVGNPAEYVTVRESLAAGNSSWTRYSQDNALAGPRQAFTLDGTHVGADLLGESAAALALAAMVLRRSGGDAGQAQQFLDGAVSLYALATSTPGAEQSYCDFIPCTVNVTTKKTVGAVPLPTRKNLDPASIKCWVPDYPRATCSLVTDEAACLDDAADGPIYSRRSSCCAYMRAAGVWTNQTTPQGACALVEGQFDCWVPDKQLRTCLPSSIDVTTGEGCTGPGLDFFPSSQSCCSQLVKEEAITPATPGQGICAKGPTTCYVPDLINRTCKMLSANTTGDQCAEISADQQFRTATACCSSLVKGQTIGNETPGTGLCATPDTTCFVVDLTGKRCLQLPNATATQATCADFASDYKANDKVSCCNKLFKAVGGIGPFFDESCRPAPTPPSPVVTLPVTLPPVTAAPAKPGTRRLQHQMHVPQRASLWGDGSGGELGIEQGDVADFGTAVGESSSSRRLLQADLPPFLQVPASAIAAEEQKEVDAITTVDFYPSTTVLDDLAWGGAALFLATDDPTYLGMARDYLDLHLRREAAGRELSSSVGYYVYNYDNVQWAVAALLAKLTDLQPYHDLTRTFLKAWVELKPPKPDANLLASRQSASRVVQQQNLIKEHLADMPGPGGVSHTYLVLDGCIPDRNNTPAAKKLADALARNRTATGPIVFGNPLAVTFEQDCTDGRDNDCDGLTDMDDPDCPFLPVQSTRLSLAWTKGAPLPHVSSASYLALFYSTLRGLTNGQKRSLRCWALGQMRYMMGDNEQPPDARSFIVGYSPHKGYKSPTRIPDRPTSCPVDGTRPCNSDSAFYPGLPNPQLELIAGALVAGPNFDDSFVDDRASNGTRVGADGNAAFVAAMAAILGTNTDVKTCGQLSGVYEDVFVDSTL